MQDKLRMSTHKQKVKMKQSRRSTYKQKRLKRKILFCYRLVQKIL